MSIESGSRNPSPCLHRHRFFLPCPNPKLQTDPLTKFILLLQCHRCRLELPPCRARRLSPHTPCSSHACCRHHPSLSTSSRPWCLLSPMLFIMLDSCFKGISLFLPQPPQFLGRAHTHHLDPPLSAVSYTLVLVIIVIVPAVTH